MGSDTHCMNNEHHADVLTKLIAACGFEAERSALFVVVAAGTVMLGFAEEGRATVGVVLSGASDGFRTYGAADGLGAFVYADDGTRSPTPSRHSRWKCTCTLRLAPARWTPVTAPVSTPREVARPAAFAHPW